MNIKIGRISSLGEEPYELKIITKDNLHTCIGEYLFYKLDEQDILVNIVGKKIIQNYQNYMLSDINFSASDVVNALGIEQSNNIIYEVTVKILGYYNTKLKTFIRPRINPTPDTLVYFAPDNMLKELLCSCKSTDNGRVHIGNLLLRNNIDIQIDTNNLINTHFAILAGTGSGKSYLARVLIEELMMSYNQGSICILDPHGEYQTLNELGRNNKFHNPALQYRPKVNTLKPGIDIQFPVCDLSFSEICSLLPNINKSMEEALSNLINKLFKLQGKNWAYKSLIQLLDQYLEEASDNNKDQSTNNSPSFNNFNALTLRGLRWRLEYRFGAKRKSNPIFADNSQCHLKNIFNPAQCTVIDLSETEEEEQQVLANILLTKAYEARVRAKNQIVEDNPEDSLEHPIFILCEEAHRFVPHGYEAISTRIIRRILGEGRKFGIGMGLISQRPGKLDSNILSQCMTQFLMRIINPDDQDNVKRSVESASRELLNELPALSCGQVIATGVALRLPLLLQVREAYSQHGGNSAKPAQDWIEANSKFNTASRQSKTAVRGTPSDYEPEIYLQ